MVVRRIQNEQQHLAIVLRTRPFRDNDLSATVLTPDCGKISVIARHAKSASKQTPLALDMFDRGRITVVRERSGGWRIKTFMPLPSLHNFRHNLEKLTMGCCLLEVFDLLLHESHTDQAPLHFELLDLSLNAINEGETLKDVLKAGYIGLSQISSMAGVFDGSTYGPSKKHLLHVLDHIERFLERQLRTRAQLCAMLDTLTAPHNSVDFPAKAGNDA